MNHHQPVMVLNGRLVWTYSLTKLARMADPLLAADGGANALGRLGLRPHKVIGDLDSISTATRNWVGSDALVHRPGQDQTDFEKALDYAFSELRLGGLTVLGGLGGRIDHTVFNLGVLAREARGESLSLRSENEILLATASSLSLEAKPGETWSFWSYDPETIVTIEGVRWPVREESLSLGHGSSISNEAVDSKVRVIPENGTVVVCRNLGD